MARQAKRVASTTHTHTHTPRIALRFAADGREPLLRAVDVSNLAATRRRSARRAAPRPPVETHSFVLRRTANAVRRRLSTDGGQDAVRKTTARRALLNSHHADRERMLRFVLGQANEKRAVGAMQQPGRARRASHEHVRQRKRRTKANVATTNDAKHSPAFRLFALKVARHFYRREHQTRTDDKQHTSMSP